MSFEPRDYLRQILASGRFSTGNFSSGIELAEAGCLTAPGTDS
jgi:hypothetical protein